MPNEISDDNRDGSLTNGCKDLSGTPQKPKETPNRPQPKIIRSICLPQKVSVNHLMEITQASSMTIMMQMQELNILGEIDRSIDFVDAARILREHGILALKSSNED